MELLNKPDVFSVKDLLGVCVFTALQNKIWRATSNIK